jgi:hypothetical protein
LQAAEIWIGTDEPEWREANHWPPNDYMALFRPDAPWQKVTHSISVFHFTKRFVVNSPDDLLSQVFAETRRRGLKIAVQATPLVATTECGRGAEGHGPPNDMEVMATKLKRIGVEPDYLVMDEPLWFGHRWNGSQSVVACRKSISTIAEETANKMKAVRRILPHVRIGDIEPMGIGEAQDVGWVDDIAQWLDAYQSAMGEPLSFFHADVVWLVPDWQHVLSETASAVKSRHILLGIIYNGTPRDKTDEEWVETAERNFKYVETTLNLQPDQAFFFSWMDRPRQMLPESKHGTFTNLVLQYLRWRSLEH